MNPVYYQTVPRKKEKTDLLACDRYLNQLILDTRIFSKESLEDLLAQYSFVVFKPNIGGGGKNVGFMKATTDSYDVQLGSKKTKITSIDELYNYIKNLSGNKAFILQRGVELLKYEGSPFDIRIEVQKPYDNWAVTGIVAKAADKEKMVTNRHSGGTGMVLDVAFANIPLDKLSEIKALLKFIGLRCSRMLNEKYEGLREVGIDIGMDRDYNAYILEINTKPQYGVFRQAGDEDMLHRIIECNKIIYNSIEYIKREL